MIYWKVEGMPPKIGLNVYHPLDTGSIGFVVRFKNKDFILRWSKRARKFFWGLQ